MIKICMIAMSSDAPIREKQTLLAPYTLKRYVENNVIPKGTAEINIIDFPFDAEPQKIASSALKYHPDVLVLSVYLWNYLELMECAQILKKEKKDVIVVAGGPMVSFNVQEVMKGHPYIDVIPYDDTRGEIIFLDIIQCLVDGKSVQETNGIVYRSNDNKLIKTKKAEGSIRYPLQSSPFINNDIVLDDENGHYVTIESSRGCYFDCGYCVWGSNRNKVEYFPMERVLKEIEIIYNNPNVKHVLFVDSNMLMKKKRAIEIVEHIKKQTYYKHISTRMHLNIHSINEELTRVLATLPDFSFDFGLQTATPEALECISKHRPNASQVKEKVELMKKWVPDIKIGIDLMIGLPFDTLDGFKKTLDFCLSLEPYRLFMAYPICLLPGTRFHEEKDKLKLHYSTSHPQALLATDDFPEPDIHEALSLATWAQILTYYYPAISDFFYFACRQKSDGEHFELMERWINLIDSKVNLIGNIKLTELHKNPVKEWYIIKGTLLEYASSAKVAYILYSTIYELHNNKNNNSLFDKKIILGLKVFSYYLEHNMNQIGKTALSSLPKEFYEEYTEDAIRRVHSIFKKSTAVKKQVV